MSNEWGRGSGVGAQFIAPSAHGRDQSRPYNQEANPILLTTRNSSLITS